MIIDPRFVDVDFTKEPAYVRGDNGARPFRGRQASYKEALEAGGAALIPQSEWPALAEKNEAEQGGLEWLVKWILNQLSEGSCVGNAGTQLHQVLQAKQFGIDNVTPLSACSLYQLIGSSPNSGASIDDCLDEGSKTGIIPLDTPENRAKFGSIVMPATGFRTKRPTGWQPIAQRFRLDESLVCNGIDEMGTALFRGNPIVVGRSGHSILYLGMVYINGKLYALYVNSWGGGENGWGQGAGIHPTGFGLDSLSYIRSSANWCYAGMNIINPIALAA